MGVQPPVAGIVGSSFDESSLITTPKREATSLFSPQRKQVILRARVKHLLKTRVVKESLSLHREDTAAVPVVPK